MVLTPDDFKRLPKDGARFEALVSHLLEAMGYRILEKPAVGPDAGRDILVERVLKDPMGEQRERVIVQCKHYALSGRSVGDSEVGVWQNAMARHRASGYLLVTDTHVTENLSRSLREFSNDRANSPKWARFWDVDELVSHLGKHIDLCDEFFPGPLLKLTPFQDFANEIRSWLEATRYEVSDLQLRDDNSADMFALLKEGSISQKVMIRCVDGEITANQVDALDSNLDRKTPQGWLISDSRVSTRARERAAEKYTIKVFSLSEFLREMIWGNYFDTLTKVVEGASIPKLYVDLGCYRLDVDEEGREVGREAHDNLDTYVDTWLTERGKLHISLLGEFGTGKTWFCRHYAHRQLKRFLIDPANQRLPLLITLRNFAKAMTAQQLINDALLEQYRLPFIGSAYDVFQRINRGGKLLLILDGFDEMAKQVDYQTVVDNFWELAKLVDDASKIILTSRTEYFRWAKESEKVLGGEEYGRRTIVLKAPKFEVLYLSPFDNSQIREVIIRRAGAEKGAIMAARVLEAQNLAEMARKPILVELLLTALEEVNSDALESPSHIYLYATEKLLVRNVEAKKTFTSTADKLFFLCELAWEMITNDSFRIHYRDIPNRITRFFGDRIKDRHELDMWDFDLRNQTLLHRDAAGYYEFAHKSLAEYFVALKFAAELGCLDLRFREVYRENDGRLNAIPIEQKSILKLASSFGAIPLTDKRMQAVRALLIGMLDENASRRLWQVIQETTGERFEHVNYAGGNAATLLHSRGESFKAVKLQYAVLAGADLRGSTLTATDLSGCDLRYADLRGARFSRDVLSGANLQQTLLVLVGIATYGEYDPEGYIFNLRVQNSIASTLDVRPVAFDLRFLDDMDVGFRTGSSEAAYEKYTRSVFRIEFLTDHPIDLSSDKTNRLDPVISSVALYDQIESPRFSGFLREFRNS